MKLLVSIMLFFAVSTCIGQQLSYRPINPAFGGDTFNYTWLLNSANSQNSFTDPNASSRAQRSEIDRFAESLNRQLLGQISRTLLSTQLGDGLQEGNFSFGSLSLEIFDSEEGLVINILDTTTGEQTQVIVPN